MEETKIRGRKHIKIKCSHTGKMFWKDKAEYNRRLKQNPNYKFYENLSAKALSAFETSGSPIKKNTGKINEKLLKSTGNRKDKFSPYRYFIRKAKSKQKSKHSKFKIYDIDLGYLKELWESQNGICPYTNKKMILAGTTNVNKDNPLCASLDRIDPNKGYVKGNVQFVTQFVNLGKNKYSSKDIKQFFDRV